MADAPDSHINLVTVQQVQDLLATTDFVTADELAVAMSAADLGQYEVRPAVPGPQPDIESGPRTPLPKRR